MIIVKFIIDNYILFYIIKISKVKFEVGFWFIGYFVVYIIVSC